MLMRQQTLYGNGTQLRSNIFLRCHYSRRLMYTLESLFKRVCEKIHQVLFLPIGSSCHGNGVNYGHHSGIATRLSISVILTSIFK